MPTLPTVRGGASSVLYPLVRRVVCDTGIAISANGNEQRWKRRAPLYEFDFAYSDILKVDRNALLTFFDGQKGPLVADWQATYSQINSSGSVVSTTYNNLGFQVDEFTASMPSSYLYRIGLKATQTQNRASVVPSVAPIFPTFSIGGQSVQVPYAPGSRTLTTFGDSPTGTRYGYGWYNTGLTGFPSRDLRYWALEFPIMPDVDVATLETFFLGMDGRLNLFQFTEPAVDGGNVYTSCRFASDTLEIKYAGINAVSISVGIVETN